MPALVNHFICFSSDVPLLFCRFKSHRWPWLYLCSCPQIAHIWSSSSSPFLCSWSQWGLCLLPQEQNPSEISAPWGLPPTNVFLSTFSLNVFTVMFFTLMHMKSLPCLMICHLRRQTVSPASRWSVWYQNRKLKVTCWALPLSFCLLTSYGWPQLAEMAYYVSGKLPPW